MQKKLSIILILSIIFSLVIVPVGSFADDEAVNITVLGTSDIHGVINSYDYASESDYGDKGLARISTAVNKEREANKNTILIDNGDTIQGSLLTDDLYNTNLEKENPMIALMNIMEYDAMVLGNHEFNFGMDVIAKLKDEANFPILSANTYYKKDESNYVGTYIIKEYDGVKVGILGLTVPSIPRWDGPKVEPLMFKHMGEEAKKYVAQMREEGADVVIVSAHAGLETRHETDGSDAAKYIAIMANPDVLITGHDHSRVNEVIGTTQVVAPMAKYGHMVEIAKVDLSIKKEGDNWTVASKTPSFLKIADYDEDMTVVNASTEYDETTKNFLKDPIGKATGNFHPESSIKGIPEGQIRDTAVVDLINDVQLKYTGAEVSAAALFKPTSNIKEGEVSYSDIFNIYKYPNTLYGVEVTGEQLKKYMEWSASYFNTYQPGDLTISFNPEVRGYNYDMFAGVDYEIDISKPAGQRIKNVTMNGKVVTDDQIIKLAVNNYRFGGLQNMGVVTKDEFFTSDPKSLRSYIKDYIKEKGTIDPTVDNNWKIVGADLSHPLRDKVIELVNNDEIKIPTSADGRTVNVKSLNIFDVLQRGKIQEDVYTVTEADTINSIAKDNGYEVKDILDFNELSNANKIKTGVKLYIPKKEKIVIVHTNDTHSRVEAGKYAGMGFAAVATKVNELRDNNDSVLLLDGGDTFHGQVISQLNEGESIVKVMNTMEYDATVPGNHDFNYGQDRLLELNSMTDFPILSSNVVNADNKTILPESKIIYKNGLKIGLFGLSTPETAYKTHPDNVEGLTFRDPKTVAQEMVNKLEDKTDIIIALSHLGVDENTKEEYTSKYVASQVNGIDIMVDGHSHTSLAEGLKVNDTLIVQAGEHDKYFGIANIELVNGKVYSKNAKLFTKDEASNLEDNIDVLNSIKDIKAENEVITSVEVATSDMELNGERAFVRGGQTNLGNLITKAMIEETGADIALTNGGGIRASIAKGTVTKGDVITVLPFGNYVVKVNVSGKAIKEAMEHGLSAYPEVEGFFPHIAGMTVKFDSTKEVGSRVTEIIINGEMLDESKTYTMATNDFLAAGGDSYEMFDGLKIVTEFGGLDEILIDWMKDNGTNGAITDDRIKDISDEISFLSIDKLAA